MQIQPFDRERFEKSLNQLYDIVVKGAQIPKLCVPGNVNPTETHWLGRQGHDSLEKGRGFNAIDRRLVHYEGSYEPRVPGISMRPDVAQENIEFLLGGHGFSHTTPGTKAHEIYTAAVTHVKQIIEARTRSGHYARAEIGEDASRKFDLDDLEELERVITPIAPKEPEPPEKPGRKQPYKPLPFTFF